MNPSADNMERDHAAEPPVEAAPSELVHNLLRLLQIARYRKQTILPIRRTIPLCRGSVMRATITAHVNDRHAG